MYALVMNFNESYKFSTLWHFLHVTWIGWYPLHFKRSVKSSGVLFRHYEWCWKILSPVKNPLQKKQCLFIYVLSSDMILASLLYFLAYWWGGGGGGIKGICSNWYWGKRNVFIKGISSNWTQNLKLVCWFYFPFTVYH